MTNEQKQVRDWMLAFGQECPEKPLIPSLEVRKLRAKLILEEALETIWSLGFGIKLDGASAAAGYVFDIADVEFKNDFHIPDLTKIADGCEDLKVVTEGTLVACGLLQSGPVDEQNPEAKPDGTPIGKYEYNDPLFDEVMRSNWSKFWSHRDITEVRLGDNVTSLGAIGADFDNKYAVKEVADNKYIVTRKLEAKVIKSPSYSPANLQPIIDEMSKTN